MDEAHVQHLVGFVENQELNLIQPDSALANQIDEATGRGDKDIATLAHIADLALNFHATKDALGDAIGELRIVAKALRNLCGKLPCGGQNQHSGGFALASDLVAGKVVQCGQCEGGCFSCASLSDAEQVALFQQMRDGLRLNWGRCFIPLFGNGFKHVLVQAEVCKFCQICLLINNSACTKIRRAEPGLFKTGRLIGAACVKGLLNLCGV